MSKEESKNTYSKFVPNVFLAKCVKEYTKGDSVILTTKYGKEIENIIFNLIFQRDGFFYYSIVRADGYNCQERAKSKANKYINWSNSAVKKSNEYFKVSHDAVRHIPFGQPILVGHHSEKRHRRDISKSWDAMGKSVEYSEKAQAHENKAEYWEKMADKINLSMPESIEYYYYILEKAKEYHKGLLDGTYKRDHSYTLVYAKKALNEAEKKYNLALKLWGD